MTYKQLRAKLKICRTNAERDALTDVFLAENAKCYVGATVVCEGFICLVTDRRLTDIGICYDLQSCSAGVIRDMINIPEGFVMMIQ